MSSRHLARAVELLTALFATGPVPIRSRLSATPQPVDLCVARRECLDSRRLSAAFGAGRADILPLSQTWRNDPGCWRSPTRSRRRCGRRRWFPVAALVPAPSAPAGRIDVTRARETVGPRQRPWWSGSPHSGAVEPDRRRSCLPRGASSRRWSRRSGGLPAYEVVGLGGLLLTPEVQDVVALLSVAHDAGRGIG